MDIFDARSARAMLTGREGPAFDDPAYLFELKLDGDRCLAYLDAAETVLINKRGRYVLGYLPELAAIHTQVRERCVLDGELIIGSGRKHEFGLLRGRLAAAGHARRDRGARANPATFLAFDILYMGRRDLLDLPLTERKEALRKTVAEGPRLALSRFVPERGKEFFDLVSARGLEGIMAKRAASPYRMGKRSTDWVKCKNWDRDVFVILGYVPSGKANVVSLILAQYREGALAYAGRVVLGRRTADFRRVASLPETGPAMAIPRPGGRQGETPVWVAPVLVCEVEFLYRTDTGGLRQPLYKALRPDLAPGDAVWPETLSRAFPEDGEPD